MITSDSCCKSCRLVCERFSDLFYYTKEKYLHRIPITGFSYQSLTLRSTSCYHDASDRLVQAVEFPPDNGLLGPELQKAREYRIYQQRNGGQKVSVAALNTGQ